MIGVSVGHDERSVASMAPIYKGKIWDFRVSWTLANFETAVTQQFTDPPVTDGSDGYAFAGGSSTVTITTTTTTTTTTTEESSDAGEAVVVEGDDAGTDAEVIPDDAEVSEPTGEEEETGEAEEEVVEVVEEE